MPLKLLVSSYVMSKSRTAINGVTFREADMGGTVSVGGGDLREAS